MIQRRIVSAFFLSFVALCLLALGSQDLRQRASESAGLWRALIAPQSARAAESNQMPTALASPTAIHNPFVTEDAEDIATENPPAKEQQPAKAPVVNSHSRGRYAEAPTLEPVRQRRTNPQLAAGRDDQSGAESPPAQMKPKARYSQRTVAPKPESTPKANRYAKTLSTPQVLEPAAEMPANDPVPKATGEIMPVSHNDPVPEPTEALQPVPEPEPAVPAEEPAAETDTTSADSPTDAPVPTLAETPELPDAGTVPQALPPAEEMPVADAGDQRGGVTLQWITPSTISVDQEATCQLLIRNMSDAAARFVVVEVQLPARVEIGATEPKASSEGRRMMFRIGDMAPGASQTAHISFTPREQGDVNPRAAVTFTRHVATTIQIVEPQLALAIEGPRESIVGQPTPYQFRVTNKGTGPAVGVSIDVTPGDGLQAANGSQSRYTIGTLSPGESRHVQVMMSGSQQGECALHGRAFIDQRAMEKASFSIRIVQPELTVAMEGPKLRFVDRRAAYTITVQNPGPAPIDNVQLLEQVPEGFRFVEASSGGNYDRNVRQVSWFVGRLDANETATVGVQLIAVEAGDHRLNAAAKADCGVIGEAETTTRIKGAPHVAIEVTEDDDPVEVDGETIYRIRLSNMGSNPARRVQVAAEVPREMQILDINGPATGLIKGQQLVFPPVDSLEAGQSISYDVHVKCSKAGQVRFKAYFRSEDAPEPVLEEEATRIYAD